MKNWPKERVEQLLAEAEVEQQAAADDFARAQYRFERSQHVCAAWRDLLRREEDSNVTEGGPRPDPEPDDRLRQLPGERHPPIPSFTAR